MVVSTLDNCPRCRIAPWRAAVAFKGLVVDEEELRRLHQIIGPLTIRERDALRRWADTLVREDRAEVNRIIEALANGAVSKDDGQQGRATNQISR